jgi:hypothetical protein
MNPEHGILEVVARGASVAESAVERTANPPNLIRVVPAKGRQQIDSGAVPSMATAIGFFRFSEYFLWPQ